MHSQSFTITNIFDWCLKFFILLTPIIWLPGITQNSLQLMIFHYGSILLFSIAIISPSKRDFKNYNILILLLLSTIVTLIRFSKGISVGYLNIVFGCLLYYAIVHSVKDVRSVSRWFVYAVWINIGFMLFQLMGLDLLYSNETMDVSGGVIQRWWQLKCGLMAKNNHLGMFLAMVCPMIAATYTMFLVTVGGVILLLKSHSATYGYFVGMIVIVLLRGWRRSTKIIGILMITFLIALLGTRLWEGELSSMAYKFECWWFYFKGSFVNPFIGNGIGALPLHTGHGELGLSSSIIENSYNEYIRFMYEFGVLPFIIFTLSMVSYYANLFKKAKNYFMPRILLASISAILVVFFFQDPLHIPRLAVPIIVIFALFEASCLEAIKKEVVND